MKKTLIIAIAIFIGCIGASAQDIIVTNDGKSIEAIVMEISSSYVKYKRYDYQRTDLHSRQRQRQSAELNFRTARPRNSTRRNPVRRQTQQENQQTARALLQDRIMYNTSLPPSPPKRA